MIDASKYHAALCSAYAGIAGLTELLRPALGGIVVAKDCSNVDALPPFTIGIDGFDYVLTPWDYVV